MRSASAFISRPSNATALVSGPPCNHPSSTHHTPTKGSFRVPNVRGGFTCRFCPARSCYYSYRPGKPGQKPLQALPCGDGPEFRGPMDARADCASLTVYSKAFAELRLCLDTDRFAPHHPVAGCGWRTVALDLGWTVAGLCDCNLAVLLGQHLHLQQRVEHLPVQQSVPQLAVEAPYVSVLPRRPGLDVQGLSPHVTQPFPDGSGGESRPAVQADVPGYSPSCYQPGKGLNHIRGTDAASARYSLVYSQVAVNGRTTRPSLVLVWTKS